jgi:hypothetical protein
MPNAYDEIVAFGRHRPRQVPAPPVVGFSLDKWAFRLESAGQQRDRTLSFGELASVAQDDRCRLLHAPNPASGQVATGHFVLIGRQVIYGNDSEFLKTARTPSWLSSLRNPTVAALGEDIRPFNLPTSALPTLSWATSETRRPQQAARRNRIKLNRAFSDRVSTIAMSIAPTSWSNRPMRSCWAARPTMRK